MKSLQVMQKKENNREPKEKKSYKTKISQEITPR